MNSIICLLFFLIYPTISVFSQTKFTSDPDSAVFQTSDINNFWKAFDDFQKNPALNNFGPKYIEIGSAGVQGFIPSRIESADHLYSVVKKRKADYEKVRENTLKIREKEKHCRSIFYALKYLYPDAVFPPTYFVIGAYNSGGTFNEDGLFIGAEMQSDINNIPYIVAHELIHYQQKNWSENPTLLQQSIVEGSADFLGELISGVNTNNPANIYGNANEERLCMEFISKMDSTDYMDWLYGVSGKDDRPNDLGYWMGYKISAQYYSSNPDKRKAIYEILDIKDYKDFLKKSGFLDKYLR